INSRDKFSRRSMIARWSLEILVIADDAVPAAERRKNVAPGASQAQARVPLPGDAEPRKGRKICAVSFAPPGLGSTPIRTPGLRPGLRSCAAPRRLELRHLKRSLEKTNSRFARMGSCRRCMKFET